MSKFIVEMINKITGAVMDARVNDEVLNSLSEAEDYASECSGAFAEGEETLDLMGEDFISSEDVEFVAVETDD